MMNFTELPVFYIKTIPVYGDLILAPMDGISDHPFRALVRSFGSAISYTEFIPALDAIHGRARLKDHIHYTQSERPVIYQLLDNDPERLLLAAQNLLPFKPDAIDINLGCPAKDISNRGAGSGLLRHPETIARIFSLLSRNLPIPVTAKIRLGWDQNTLNYREVALAIQENGGACIAVHGRTRQQAYSGIADWDAIADVKACVTLPVIANGDVNSVADIQRIKQHTACEAIMIGRAALGNPWIFMRLDRSEVSPELKFKTVTDHLTRMVEFYGVELGVTRFRKHLIRYMADESLPSERKHEMVTTLDPVRVLEIARNNLLKTV
jgi:tRNA-dihydrouridine synthase B